MKAIREVQMWTKCLYFNTSLPTVLLVVCLFVVKTRLWMPLWQGLNPLPFQHPLHSRYRGVFVQLIWITEIKKMEGLQKIYQRNCWQIGGMGKKINQGFFEFGRMVVTVNRNKEVGRGASFEEQKMSSIYIHWVWGD